LARAALILTLLQFGASAATFVQQVFIARVVGATTETDGYQVALAMVVFVAQGIIATALVNAFVPRLVSLAREDVDSSRAFAFWAQINVVSLASVVTVW
jgi:O-antigen/teichoic acid export membrane protein